MANSRRDFVKKSALLGTGSAFGLAPSSVSASDRAEQETPDWPITEGPNTPKLVMAADSRADQWLDMRKMKQLGASNVMSYEGPELPWREDQLRLINDHFQRGGMNLVNLYIGGFDDVIYGREGRDEQIEQVQASLRAAGAAGIPVVEYNWYADRLTEGYYYVEGRGGAGYTGYDYSRVDDLPPEPEIGTHSAEELWDRLAYFLEAVIPVAEEAGVRMCVHPNDPPAPQSHGSAQILSTLDGWKRLIELVDSPSNGITYDCGVTTELGEDAVEVARYFGSRDRINHCHFRNVRVEEPYDKYVEVFIDEGECDMFGVMRELVRQNYTLGIYPEHPRALDYDRARGLEEFYPGGGGYAGYAYNIGYARAMMQAALIAEGKA